MCVMGLAVLARLDSVGWSANGGGYAQVVVQGEVRGGVNIDTLVLWSKGGNKDVAVNDDGDSGGSEHGEWSE